MPRGCLPRGVSAQDGVCLGVSARGGVSQDALGQKPPVNRMTERCKNIILPQLRCGR